MVLKQNLGSLTFLLPFILFIFTVLTLNPPLRLSPSQSPWFPLSPASLSEERRWEVAVAVVEGNGNGKGKTDCCCCCCCNEYWSSALKKRKGFRVCWTRLLMFSGKEAKLVVIAAAACSACSRVAIIISSSDADDPILHQWIVVLTASSFPLFSFQ